MLSWGILFYISSYLSALNSLCRIQQRPWMLGHIVPGMYALPQPVQRSRSFQASPRGQAQFPCLLNQREHCREELHLILRFIYTQPIIQEGHRATTFADAVPQIRICPQFLSAISLSPFIHCPYLVYVKPCTRLWTFGDKVVPSGSSLQGLPQ